jgi:hypothetical protein
VPKWRFWERGTEPAAAVTAPESPPSAIAPRATGFHPPPPRDAPARAARDPESEERLARLRRRRETVLFDVERSELAAAPDNPWLERMALIDEALATVEADRRALDALPIRPGLPLPATPIVDVAVTTDPPSSVMFRIGAETFTFEEEIDWAERGTQVVRPELIPRAGRPEALVPATIPADRREKLVEHLAGSLFVFATDLRDRALNGEAMPVSPTLADLARPCEDCGGWRDWHGVCPECQRRDWERRRLDAETERLRAERAREVDERSRLADRLPIALRRLADVDAEIAAAGG